MYIYLQTQGPQDKKANYGQLVLFPGKLGFNLLKTGLFCNDF
jgi:hypothetical protein